MIFKLYTLNGKRHVSNGKRHVIRYIGKDGHGHAGTDRRTRTDGHGHADTKDGQLWKRRALMEKTDTYGKDGHLWKRRALMEKTGNYGKDRNKVFKSEIFSRETHTAHNQYYTYCK